MHKIFCLCIPRFSVAGVWQVCIHTNMYDSNSPESVPVLVESVVIVVGSVVGARFAMEYKDSLTNSITQHLSTS